MCKKFSLLFFFLVVSAATNGYAQVSDSPGSVSCPSTVGFSLKVMDKAGAVIPNSLVILREDTSGQFHRGKGVMLELQTDATGNVTAELSCNYFDILVAHDGFAPVAQKRLVTKGDHAFSITLEVGSVRRVFEVPHTEPD